ncbi:unnamed protein product [Zymoseptoria tritici ST99CH_1A5]|uniref:VOC domain-containing protein n=3 Tax=Zymoseptoria tritici TaxID=1047171 RepID=A0A1X7S053_ZYMT9|nr:unnamed protein product [Zymoseptoria tritici ST99CH_3D7]SMR55398.1 unnamed protein product [Zymoseptoria tritici ST99CH_1E4]SMR57775.1 unnamed protein product [Zymoseptoria tritici ST99CH_3D1]SMY26209.1 unnamed protein product [Zymoseptoria tritici ST99CH_1A5]
MGVNELALSFVLNVVSKLPLKIREGVAMRIPPIANNPDKVQLASLGHAYFEHPDLDQFEAFAEDFGFVVERKEKGKIYFRGYGKDPYIYVASQSADGKPHFRGPAFVAQSQEDFDKAKALPGAQLGSLADAPGGGEIVTFDRADDTFFHVIFGQKMRDIDGTHAPSATHEEVGPTNTAFQKPRKGNFLRFHEGAALIHKLGHFGYVHRKFDEELKWYTDNFNFVPSDILHHWDFPNIDVMTFMHLDLGKEYSDHHIFFMQRSPPEVTKTYLHHSSYEVEDLDTQLIGHHWLAKKGWKSVWGVGRHVLGSQIFDYWQDPSGFKIEHYADGDLVNQNTVTKRDVVGPLSVWGPELPKDFGDDGTLLLI